MRWLARLSELRMALLITLVLCAAYVPLSRTAPVRELQWRLLDMRFALRAPAPVSDEIALVLIDEASLRAVGRWPWSRAVLARLITNLERRATSSSMCRWVTWEARR